MGLDDEVVRIAYLGPDGTFTQIVAADMNGDVKYPLWVEQGKIDRVVIAVAKGEADRGVVPLRAESGDVDETLRAIHRVRTAPEGIYQSCVYITGYGEKRIKLYLAGKPGTKLADVRTVLSKDRALATCKEPLDELLQEDYVAMPVDSTSLAAKIVAETPDYSIAALCNETAVEIYGLASLVEYPIESMTRFIRLGNQEYKSEDEAKGMESAVMIRLYIDRPGILKSIAEAVTPVNMTDIHLLKGARDHIGKANVFILRLEAGIRATDLVIGCLKAVMSKEVLYGVEQKYMPRIDWIGTYPVMDLNGS